MSRIAMRSRSWKLRGELAKVEDGLREIMVMGELPRPKKSFVLFRGEYAQRRDEVQGGTPAALSPFPPPRRATAWAWLSG